MWDRPYALPTFLRMLVQALLAVSLVLYGFSPLVLLAIILLGVSMILDPRDRPLEDQPGAARTPLDPPAPIPPSEPGRSDPES